MSSIPACSGSLTAIKTNGLPRYYRGIKRRTRHPVEDWDKVKLNHFPFLSHDDDVTVTNEQLPPPDQEELDFHKTPEPCFLDGDEPVEPPTHITLPK